MTTEDPDVLQRALARESKRRQKAEALLEQKSRELYHSYQELEEAHASLKENQAQLVQAEKMASMGVLSAGVAHEINNPIAFVLANLSTLENYAQSFTTVFRDIDPVCRPPANGTEPTIQARTLKEAIAKEDIPFLLEDMPQLLKETKQGLERVRDITQGLQTFTQKKAEVFKPIDIIACVKGTVELCNVRLDTAVDLEIDNHLNRTLVTGSYSGITEVVTELIENAHYAAGDCGHIRVSIGTCGSRAVIQVEDNGSGISILDQQKLFLPFFTTKPVGAGVGLGLARVFGIMQEHNGQIEVESKEGIGSKFVLRFPTVPGRKPHDQDNPKNNC